MGLRKNNFLCVLFFVISVMTFCAETQANNLAVTYESNSIKSCAKDYVFSKMQDWGFKVFYKYLDSALIDYKNNNFINYKIGMRYISGRYIFQDINQLHDGQTLLHQAVLLKNGHAMKMLLFFGADPGVANSDGVTSYDMVVKYKDPYYLNICDEYKKINKKRSDLEVQTISQKYYVKMMHKLMALQGADKQALIFLVDSLNDYQKRHPFMTHLFLYVIDGKCIDEFINITDADLTLLQHCIEDNNIDLAQILLYLGADPMKHNRWGLSAFDSAIKNKNIQFLKLFWPYVACEALRPEIYPLMIIYKDELLECVREQGSINFMHAVYHYFDMQYEDEQDCALETIVDFWN